MSARKRSRVCVYVCVCTCVCDDDDDDDDDDDTLVSSHFQLLFVFCVADSKYGNPLTSPRYAPTPLLNELKTTATHVADHAGLGVS